MQHLSTILTTSLFILYVIIWRIQEAKQKKQFNLKTNVLSTNQKPIQKLFASYEKLMTIGIVAIIITHALPINSKVTEELIKVSSTHKLFGFALGIIGLTICRIAQITMGKSWRVGIEEDAKPGLITNGIFKYIRNPTYAGLFLLCAGILIIHPSVLYAFWIQAFILIINFQVRCEEEYLIQKYGANYLSYIKKTKRYIPGLY